MNINLKVDDEWANFMMSSSKYDSSSDEEDEDLNDILKETSEDYISSANIIDDLNVTTPTPSDIYISTKTKIAYLNIPINLKQVFWDVPVIPYSKPVNGVIKKQMKFNSLEESELVKIQERLKSVNFYEEHIITHINNPNGRIKFKDIRKISIGISKKDITSYRSKKKSAFYNCFVLIIRMKLDDIFKEFHIKVFNTGKLEIPGVQSEDTFNLILGEIITILQPHITTQLKYKENCVETVLINSNFNCGFFINRESLYDILCSKYNLQSIYDPCSYPGIQCKFYYNPEVGIQTGCQISEENKEKYKNVNEVSFMIFRTGSVLIVGKCDEKVLILIYEFIKNILVNEYKIICQKNFTGESCANSVKDKKKKIRRKNITVEVTNEE